MSLCITFDGDSNQRCHGIYIHTMHVKRIQISSIQFLANKTVNGTGIKE